MNWYARVALNKYLSMSISLNELMPLVIGQWTGEAAKRETRQIAKPFSVMS